MQTVEQLISTSPPNHVGLAVGVTGRLAKLMEAERTRSVCYFLEFKSLVQSILHFFAAT